ncbi:MAG: histidinol-phosphate aminotransferase family protein [Candidatus Cloacimonetes bacterium]|nr:histidinol-phosphate aminotransferase family protein [Candidatus Cloacimonadota bacterium]
MYLYRKDLEEKEAVKVEVPRKRIMMSLNESSLNPLGVIKEAFISNLGSVSLNRYLSDISNKLSEMLLEYIGYNIDADQILMGNGADQMLYYLFLAVRDNADNFALSLAPSYFDYKSYCSAVGLGFKTHELNRDFDFSPDEYLKSADDPNCRLIIICYPNNPTGNLFDEKKIIHILKKAKVPVLIDETYFEFSGKTFVNHLSDFKNLIIVRSFSKSFSVAGLRFGYMISSAKNIKEIGKVFTAFNLSLLIQTFAYTLLENKDKFLEHTKRVIKLRQILYNNLASIKGITVYPSETNFLIFTMGIDTMELFDYLSKQDVSVRSMHKLPLLANHLRVSISSESDNQYFVDAVKEFMRSRSKE